MSNFLAVISAAIAPSSLFEATAAPYSTFTAWIVQPEILNTVAFLWIMSALLVPQFVLWGSKLWVVLSVLATMTVLCRWWTYKTFSAGDGGLIPMIIATFVAVVWLPLLLFLLNPVLSRVLDGARERLVFFDGGRV